MYFERIASKNHIHETDVKEFFSLEAAQVSSVIKGSGTVHNQDANS